MGMKKYEVMKFRIGDLFYENDDLSSHMLRLFAIYNDLIVVYKYIGDTEVGQDKAPLTSCRKRASFLPPSNFWIASTYEPSRWIERFVIL